MEDNKKNEEFLSRREFFKKAAKSALPFLAAIALADVPAFLKATEKTPSGCMGCSNTCMSSCKGSCSGNCKTGCQYECKGSCKTGCYSGCKNDCKGGCKSSCRSSCTGTCKDSCSHGCTRVSH